MSWSLAAESGREARRPSPPSIPSRYTRSTLTAQSEEAIVPFDVPRDRVPVATQFRSTWLASSLRALRDRGLYEAYRSLLDPAAGAEIDGAVAGTWLSVSVALAHYEACDALALSPSVQAEIGHEVTRFVHKSTYGLVLRMSREAGVTPWTCFAMQNRLWTHTWRGGAAAAYKLGPKEARIEIAGWPCARIRYCRTATRGLLAGQTEMFCRKAYVQEIAALCSDLTLAYRVSWA